MPAKIIFVNIGQGDAVVMRIGGKIIVSDTGQHDYEVLERRFGTGVSTRSGSTC